MMDKKPHVSNNTGNQEWYTPPYLIEAVRRVMGRIDCDPASCEIANRTVGATQYYTKEQDGLVQPWGENCFLNPPYAAKLVSQFADAVADRILDGSVKQICVLVNNATETKWFRRMAGLAAAVCFIESRVKFFDQDGNPSGSPLQGQAMIYIGPKVDAFRHEFSDIGLVLIRPASRNKPPKKERVYD